MKIHFCIVFLLLLFFSCKKENSDNTTPPIHGGTIDYRFEMRQFVVKLAQYARQTDGDFIVIPQNGQELCFENGMADDPMVIDYLAAIDGQGREELFYGYDNEDDLPTPSAEQEKWLSYLEKMRDAGIKILVTDYCHSEDKIANSYELNEGESFISFAADARELTNIPHFPASPFHENTLDVQTLSDAQNFLYIINTQEFADKSAFKAALSATNYDVILMDAFFDDEPYSATELNLLKQKANGGHRLVIAYMSIGEAEDYRFYWQPSWSFNPPDWIAPENPDWAGNFAVHYWNDEWQSIIYGNESSYLKKIMDSGFDGVYLDIIDAYEYWE